MRIRYSPSNGVARSVRDIVEDSGLLRQKTDEQRRELKHQLTDLERRIVKWQEAFETEADSAAVVLPRLRELQAKHAELTQTLGKVVPLRVPPPHLTIERFRQTIRDVFLSADQTLAENYLRFLVERIVVQGDSLEIHGKADASRGKSQPRYPAPLIHPRKFLLPQVVGSRSVRFLEPGNTRKSSHRRRGQSQRHRKRVPRSGQGSGRMNFAG